MNRRPSGMAQHQFPLNFLHRQPEAQDLCGQGRKGPALGLRKLLVRSRPVEKGGANFPRKRELILVGTTGD